MHAREIRGEWPTIAALVLLPVVFFGPNILAGGVMLPADILYQLEPYGRLAPPELTHVRNPNIPDLMTLYYPGAELFRSAASLVSLWNPYSFCGSPSLANAQNGNLFPLSWLLRFLPLGPAYLLIALGKMWFCGIFAYLFYRRVGFGSFPAALGGICFMFAGHMIAWFGYPTSWPLCSWPFLFWALERFADRRRPVDLAWLSLGFGLVFIGGQPQTGFLISVAAVLYLAFRRREPGQGQLHLWLGFAVSGVLGLFLAAPQLLPFLEYLRLSAAGLIRAGFGHYGWKYYRWYTLLSWAMPRFFGDGRTGNFWGFSSFVGEAIYVGSIPLIFAFLGAIGRKHRNDFRKSVLAIFLMGFLGLYVKPLSRVYLALPLLSSIDNDKLLALVSFGLISFAVLGFEVFFAQENSLRGLLAWWMWIAGAWIAFAAFGFFHFRDAMSAMKLWAFEEREACWLIGVLAAGGLILWLAVRKWTAARTAATLVLLVTVVDLFRVWIYYYPSFPTAYLRPRSEAVSYLQRNAGEFRVMGFGEVFQPETSILFRLQDARGYDGMTPYAYFRMLAKIDPDIQNLWRRLQRARPPAGGWGPSTLFFSTLEPYLNGENPQVEADLSRVDYWSDDINRIERPALLSMLGVRFVLTPKGHTVPEAAGLRLVHSSDADVWENPRVLPRAFIATRPVFVASDDAALELVSAGVFDFEATAVVTGRAPGGVHAAVQDNAPGKIIPAEIVRHDAEDVEIRADSPEGGWLILSDLYYPGWEASCDNNPAAIYPGNFLFRAISVPPGLHVVKLVYRPASFRLGLLLALIAALAIMWILMSAALSSWRLGTRTERS